MVSQAENAGTVASGDTAGQALAGGGGEPVGTGVGGPEDVAPEELDVAADDAAADEMDEADEADEEGSGWPVPMRPPLRSTWRISSRRAR